MKKILMASSAIVGAAALAASPAAAQELSLNAFQVFTSSAGDADVDGSDRGFAFSTNTEVHVKGEIMADNGITFGFRVEFEADSGEDNNVDENSIYAQGSFGKIELGNNDGPEDTFMVNGSNSGVDYGGVGNPTSNFLDTAYAGKAKTSIDLNDSSDATKINYTSPNFNGFSFGIAYTPDTADGSDGNSFYSQPEGGDGGVHDHIGLGIGFDGEFNGVGVEIGLIGQASISGFDAEPEDDQYGFGGGFAISYAGFTFAAGGFWEDQDDGGSGFIDSGEAYGVDAGIGYTTGPWRFSGNFIYTDNDDSDDELIAGSANVGYSVAPGVRVFLTGFIGNEDYGSATSADTGESDNDILAVTSGLAVSF